MSAYLSAGRGLEYHPCLGMKTRYIAWDMHTNKRAFVLAAVLAVLAGWFYLGTGPRWHCYSDGWQGCILVPGGTDDETARQAADPELRHGDVSKLRSAWCFTDETERSYGICLPTVHACNRLATAPGAKDTTVCREVAASFMLERQRALHPDWAVGDQRR